MFSFHPALCINGHFWTQEWMSSLTDGGLSVNLTAFTSQISFSYQSGHAELQTEHQIQLLSLEPVHHIRVLSHSQRLSADTEQTTHAHTQTQKHEMLFNQQTLLTQTQSDPDSSARAPAANMICEAELMITHTHHCKHTRLHISHTHTSTQPPGVTRSAEDAWCKG